MGAKPKKSRSGARSSSVKRSAVKRTPASRTPARKAAGKAAQGKASTSRRSGATVDGYVGGLVGWQRDAAEQLRSLIRDAAPHATESFKWGQPVYEENGPFCYFKTAPEHITF